MDVSRYADLFLSESREHLTAFNHLLLEWERDPAAREPVDGVFRAAHSLKGMAATMGYAAVADLAHRTESLLDVVRRARAAVTPAQLDLLFRAADALERAVAAAVAGRDDPAPLAGLAADLDAAVAQAAPPGAAAPQPAAPAAGGPGPGPGRSVRVALAADAALKGARALLVLARAAALGAVHGVQPPPGAMEAEDFDGRFAFRLDTRTGAPEIEAALRGAGDVETVEVVEEAAESAAEAGRARHIRVDLRRLDELMNLIGELVIARGRLDALARRFAEPDLADVATDVGRLSASLQSEILQARMVPVWQVFDRFPRMVRDLARQMGKQVAFRVEGKEIELDRVILDEIADPLVHLLRNAVDHGIEPPAERAAAGKPPLGQLVLAAERERSSVVVRVADDGRGIDRARVLRRARELGLVADEVEQLSDDDTLAHLIALAGFSTAEHVTDISGRGVGIDAVVTTVRALGGSLEVKSQDGRGTAFTLRLPTTLAIVRALLARVGTETYALPLTHVVEMVESRRGEVQLLQGKEVLVLRGQMVPLVRLWERLGVPHAGPRPPRQPVIVLAMGERRSGVVVDALLGQEEIVVRPFDLPRGAVPVFSGATILGDGAPALILDAGGLI
ncbi:MAG TPA: chemotaxis protein CheA [Gemmatimonadales bacterium]|nr:chemotaxis protein CheA [Gemmatimonadales bacterium]